MSYKVVILFSGSGSNMEAIIRACPDVAFPVVITDNGQAYGLVRAGELNVPAFVCEQRKGQSREEYCMELAKTVEWFRPDLIVLAGFMKILTSEFIAPFEGQIINIHPSLLPKYKGLDTHKRAIEAGDTVHGMTIHYVVEELDSGPIICQHRCIVKPQDCVESLQNRVHQLEHTWFPRVVQDFADGNLP